MKPFVVTPLAARDLNEIWDYMASDNIKAVLGGVFRKYWAMLKAGPWEFLGDTGGAAGSLRSRIQHLITRAEEIIWLSC